MQKQKELALRLIDIFEKHDPVPETELNYVNPYELVVSVILSAQCTDKRVNLITPALFEQFPTVERLSNAGVEEVFLFIKSCSYPNNKAKHLVGMAKMVMNHFGGEIPKSLADLQKLPGVGRKTANVVASVAFDIPTMPVDTHVFRVAQRIGLVKPSKTPLQVEEQLLKIIPPEKLHDYHHWLILHGRYICQARKPKCEKCPVASHCKYFKKNKI